MPARKWPAWPTSKNVILGHRPSAALQHPLSRGYGHHPAWHAGQICTTSAPNGTAAICPAATAGNSRFRRASRTADPQAAALDKKLASWQRKLDSASPDCEIDAWQKKVESGQKADGRRRLAAKKARTARPWPKHSATRTCGHQRR